MLFAGEVGRFVRKPTVRGYLSSANLALGGGDIKRIALVSHCRVAAEQTGQPERIPVVVERTTDTVGFGQLQISHTAVYNREVERRLLAHKARSSTSRIPSTKLTR